MTTAASNKNKSDNKTAQPSSSSFWDGLGGIINGSFFEVSPLVDTEKPPGATSLWIQQGTKEQQSVSNSLWKILTLQAFMFSPNLVWVIMAAVVYMLFPYNLHEEQGYARIVLERLVVNLNVCLSYIGFWHFAIYFCNVSHRPFVPNRQYNIDKVLHNLFYTTLGLVQWSFTEAAFIYCYQTKRLPTVALEWTPFTVVSTLVWSLWIVPPYREFQFYFAHRMLHSSFLYKYLHATHHRTTDVEPFAGLSMHPAEILYYFSCYGPLVWFASTVHPFVLFWMGFHTAITPAASHSGYEDHFSADLHHYLHHRYYECNYGAATIPLDVWFGTFKDQLPQPNQSSAPPPPLDAKASLSMILEYPLYQLAGVVLPVVLLVLYTTNTAIVSIGDGLEWRSVVDPWRMATIVTLLPVVAAALLYLFGRGAGRRHMLAPFHKDPLWSQALHFSLGFLLGVWPVQQLLAVTLS